MSYQEKRIVTGLLSGAAILAAYCLFAWGAYRAGEADAGNLAFWAAAMLKFIGVGIAATIIIQILFHILLSVGIAVREKIRDAETDDRQIEQSIKAEMVEDERDRLIELKALRVGFICAGAGFILSLVTLVLGRSPVLMLNILYLSFLLGSLLEGVVQLFLYRSGVRHG